MIADLGAIMALRPKSILDVVPHDCFIELYEPGSDYIGNGNYYEWKYAIAKHLQPRSILEIGVRYGYSLCSFIAGSESVQIVEGYDSQIYKENSNSYALHALMVLKRSGRMFTNSILTIDSQQIKALRRDWDFVHIDSSHTYEGCLHDLWLCVGHTKAILVDDTFTCPDDMKAVKEFAREPFVREVLHIPSHVGESLIILR